MTRFAKSVLLALAAIGIATVGICTACSRIAEEPPVDYSAEEERICEKYCEQNVPCQDPKVFDTHEECMAVCIPDLNLEQDNECAESARAYYDCMGDTVTCEQFHDSQDYKDPCGHLKEALIPTAECADD